ncbi:catalase-like domain-containing protein [Aspergillus spinulosporus]
MASANAGKLGDTPSGNGTFTLSNGCPIEDPLVGEQVSKTDGKDRWASQLIQDLNVIDTLSHVTRERIPERYVHAKGVGAFGVFETTNPDITKFTDAKFLQPTGINTPKKTRLFSRFSTVAGERGYPDTVRDTKGAAFKLYTEEGNLDWAFLNPEIFLIRDPVKFPSLVHATKRDPATNLPDANMFWDYFNNHPEGYNALMRIMSDEGTPKSYSRMKISSVNTYTFTKKTVERGKTSWKHTFVRIKLLPDPPVDPDMDYFTVDDATTMAGKDPDYLTRRLYDEITNPHIKNPTWNVMAQIIDPKKTKVNIFDATKIIPEEDCPLMSIGKITLTECPQNFFSQVEQAAFNPANIVPGWDVSPDPLLQIRLFMYGDTQRYRLGVNHDQLPTNKPVSYVWTPTRRDGAHNINNYGSARNYIRKDENKTPSDYNPSFLNWTGETIRFKSEPSQIDFDQCGQHWKTLKDTQKFNFINNVAKSLSLATKPVQDASLAIFDRIFQTLGQQDAEKVSHALRGEVAEETKKNKEHQNKPGIVSGGEPSDGVSYIPPTLPSPATGSQEVYRQLDDIK